MIKTELSRRCNRVHIKLNQQEEVMEFFILVFWMISVYRIMVYRDLKERGVEFLRQSENPPPPPA